MVSAVHSRHGGPSRSSVQTDLKKTDTKPVVQFRKESFVFSFYFDLLAKQVSSLRLVLNQIHVLCFEKVRNLFWRMRTCICT